MSLLPKLVSGPVEGVKLPVLQWWGTLDVNPDFVRLAPQHFEDELKAAAPPSALRQTVTITRIFIRPAVHADAIRIVVFGQAAQAWQELSAGGSGEG